MAGVADQGFTSSTNFLMNVFLARWLIAADYGAFSVAWSFCLVFAAFHNALILEPMTVIGPSEYAGRLGAYLVKVSRLNWAVAAALGVAALITGLFYRQALVRQVMLVLAICLPGYLFLLTRRREQYVWNQPIKALRMSIIYATLAGCLLAALRLSGHLSASSAVLVIGVAWLAGLFARRRPVEALPVEHVAREHWRYGKWLFASSLLAMGIPDVQTILLSLLVDLKSAGALRALMNFVLPLSQLMTVFSVYALPRFSQRMKQWGAGSGLRQTILFPALMMVVALAYAGVLLLAGPLLEHTLYNGKMAEYLAYLPMLAAAALLAALAGSFSTLLRAAQNSQHIFVSGVTGTIVGVASAFLLLKTYGIRGALWSMILANGAAALVVIGTYGMALRRQPGEWAPFRYFREAGR
jgi:O-antigen/teichoic acid export membrane protein